MTRYILLTLICLPEILFSQCLINKSKEEIKLLLSSDAKAQNNVSLAVKEKDSTVIFTLKSKGSTPTKYQCDFESGGKCIVQKITAGCDSCIQEKLNTILSDKEHQWKKLNENQFISGFESKMMIELSVKKTDHSFTIRKIDWSLPFYKILTGN
jgi:hypothetical protein